MGAKSDWLNKRADDLYDEAEELEDEAKRLKREADKIGDEAAEAEKLSVEEDTAWAELHAAKHDRRQIAMRMSA